MRTELALAVATVIGLTTSCVAPPSRQTVIQMKADDTMVNLGAAWAEAYMLQNPGVNVELSGSGPGRYGLNALEHADIVATVRPLLSTNPGVVDPKPIGMNQERQVSKP